MRIADTVMALLKPTVEAMGYELAEVEYKKEQSAMVLSLYIDSENGVTLEDCERVSRAVDPVLDDADPIPGSYYMGVFSLGIDRPLKSDADFRRNLGKQVVVKLYAPLDGKKEYAGALAAFNADAVTIDCDGAQIAIARKDAASIKLCIEF